MTKDEIVKKLEELKEQAQKKALSRGYKHGVTYSEEYQAGFDEGKHSGIVQCIEALKNS